MLRDHTRVITGRYGDRHLREATNQPSALSWVAFTRIYHSAQNRTSHCRRSIAGVVDYELIETRLPHGLTAASVPGLMIRQTGSALFPGTVGWSSHQVNDRKRDRLRSHCASTPMVAVQSCGQVAQLLDIVHSEHRDERIDQ